MKAGALLLALVAMSVASCGYHAVYASGEGARFHVVLVRSLVPDAVSADEVLSGAREELAREGALAAGDGYPRVEIEVLRLDETSEGISAPKGSPSPIARGTEVAVVARAWLVASKDAPREHDTGDVRAQDAITIGATAQADSFQHADAARAVARRVGQKLARRVLGHPAATQE